MRDRWKNVAPNLSLCACLRVTSSVTVVVLFCGVMIRQFETRSLTYRQRAHMEEQRLRSVSAAFARLEKALHNLVRPVWGPSTPDRLAYLQAKFDRRVSDPASRFAAAELIEEWRRGLMVGEEKPDPDRPPEEWTDSELMKVLSIRCHGRHVAKSEGPPPSEPSVRTVRRPPALVPD